MKRGYLEWMRWAEKLTKKGIKQKQCPCCGRWLFPTEKCVDFYKESGK